VHCKVDVVPIALVVSYYLVVYRKVEAVPIALLVSYHLVVYHTVCCNLYP